MHEASLMRALVRRVEEIARAEDAPSVTAISVWIGAMSHFSAEHFTEHFAHSSAGTIAEGAELSLTLSADVTHVNAHDVVIESVEVETR